MFFYLFKEIISNRNGKYARLKRMKNELSAEQLLQWLVTAGADEPVGNEPVDRFAVQSFLPAKKQQPAEPVFAPLPLPTPAEEMFPSISGPSPAQSVSTLEELKKAMADFNGCSLKSTATNMVFGSGDPNARLMIIGEAPGAEEDKQGLPFVGASGHLLDLMLTSIGLKRQDIYITNILPWRPPANRKPSESEIALFTPFVRRHITLVRPEILLLLGGSAVSALMGTNTGITKTRGRWMTYSDGDFSADIMASFHPAYLLRTPGQKKLAWRDLQAVRAKLLR